MRFLDLILKAYGPFTDQTLDLSGGHHGLHLVYGMNEAGKSTALRAIHAFLFGIHGQTRDNFVHGYGDLKVGARLQDGDGKEHVLWRRKGRKDTLRDANEVPVDEAVLTRLLGGVPSAVFEDAFGIDHARLVAGGKTLLAGGGEVGQSLFAAGLGSSDLRGLLSDLDSGCEDLFKGGRATRPTINRLIREYRRLVKETKSSSLAASEWTRHRKAFEQAQTQLELIDAEWQEQDTEYNRLSRLQRALPKLAQRKSLQGQLEELSREGPLPDLRDDFEESRLEAERSLDRNRAAATRAKEELKKIEDQLESLDVPEVLLARKHEIDALHQELATHRKAARDRIGLEATKQQHHASAAQHLLELRPDCDPEVEEAPTLSVAERRFVQELAERHAALNSTRDGAVRALNKLETARSKLEKELEGMPAPPAATALHAACTRARRHGDLEAERLDLHKTQAEGRRTAEDQLQSLGPWKGTLEQVGAIPVPVMASVERFESEWESMSKGLQPLDEQLATSQTRLKGLDEQLVTLERSGPVPTEENLRAARERREAGWHLIRDAWLEDKEVDESSYDAELPLPEAYEQAVAQADKVGDQLRTDAERVALKAQLLENRNEGHAQHLKLEQERAARQSDGAEHEEAWRQAWAEASIDPLPPREMRAWLGIYDRLNEHVANLRKSESAERSLSERIDAHRATLLAELKRVGDDNPEDRFPTLAELLDHAEGFAKRLDESAGAIRALEDKQAALDDQIAGARADLTDADTKLAEWREYWGQAVTPLGLDAEATPDQARAVITVLEDLREDLRQEAQYAARIEGIERDAREFDHQVGELVTKLAPDLSEETPEEAILALHNRATAASEAHSLRGRLQKDLIDRKQEAKEADIGAADSAAELGRLCAEAGAVSPEELGPIEKRARRAVELRSRVRDVEADLLNEGKGATLEALEKEAEDVDGDALETQLAACEAELEGRKSEVEQARERLGEARQALASFQGTGDAAALADEVESVAASVREYSERYVTLRLARAILHREIERYRSANQGPLLERACQIFSRLTCGAFVSLEPDYADDDTPVLLGTRSNGARIGVDAMSDGTREQLYLALRLASLEQHLEGGSALPFVVDDILLRSDEERSRAILEALADLSTTTQVLFFTHQRRQVELAESLGRPDDVFVQAL